jgi:hypothetical protein
MLLGTPIFFCFGCPIPMNIKSQCPKLKDFVVETVGVE